MACRSTSFTAMSPPKNVMINYEGVVKLTDFGIAKAVRVGAAGRRSADGGRSSTCRRSRRSTCQPTAARTFFRWASDVRAADGRTSETDDIYQTLDNVKEAPIPHPKTYRPDMPDMLSDILMKAPIAIYAALPDRRRDGMALNITCTTKATVRPTSRWAIT
jgi:serine/threonine protein kinase